MRAYLLLLLLTSVANGAEIVGVVDGDTLDARMDGKSARIRLAQIDAPERNQPFGTVAKQSLSSMAYRKDCEIQEVDRDRYGRIVAQVTCENVDVNLAMIKLGHAWAYRKYITDPGYIEAEESARSSRTGLWSEPSPVPPWDWRKQRQKSSK